MIRFVRLGVLATVICVSATAGGSARATPVTTWNWDMTGNPIPCTCTAFEVFLQGDQTSFAAAHYNSFPDPMSSVTTIKNMQGNVVETVVKFYSGNGSTIGPTVTGNYGPSHAQYPHFGVSGMVAGQTSGGERIPPLMMEWIPSTGKPVIQPTVGVNFTSGLSGTTQWLVYRVVTTAGGVSTTQFYEFPFQGTYHVGLIGTAGTVALPDGGFEAVSPTDLPLDQLNAAGVAGLSFTADPNYPPGTAIAGVTPLPAALPLFASGLGVMGLIGWRRRRNGTTLRQPRSAYQVAAL